ncbi:MAG: hypothetical protein RJA19_1700 [Bacteroidota bacterium]
MMEGPAGVRWAHLRSAAYQEKHIQRLADGSARVRWFIPDMHCAACVAFLEDLPAREPAIRHAEVNFPRKSLTIAFDDQTLPPDALATWLEKLGYPPEVREESAGSAGGERAKTARRAELGRLAVAGFCFGNIMLMSFADHLGGEVFDASGFEGLFGMFNFLLSLPILFYSGSGYFVSAWRALRSGGLNMDVPIALGIVAIMGRSTWEWATGYGMGYFDSLAGLVFFLLIGKWYQGHTHAQMSHERDYRSWFPMSVLRQEAAGAFAAVPISQLQAGDRIRIHHGEIIPADGRLLEGAGQIDRSFVTGESLPVPVAPGDLVEAGGRQLAGALLLEVIRPVEQSALTRMWNSEAFQKERQDVVTDPVNRISKRFTLYVLTIATASWAFWILRDAGTAWNALTATLIVACPCALALSLPFTYGSSMRYLGRAGAYLKNTLVVERMAGVETLVFDKTGTLTSAAGFSVRYEALPGAPGGTTEGPSAEIRDAVAAVAASSAHPLSRAIAGHWTGARPEVQGFEEHPGAGIRAQVNGQEVRIGNARWVGWDAAAVEAAFPANTAEPGPPRAAPGAEPKPAPGADLRTTFSYVAWNGTPIGRFCFTKPLRTGIAQELTELGQRYDLHLISGDSDAERAAFAPWFPADQIHFSQQPEDKMAYIAAQQAARQSTHPGTFVAMVGDGLNDAGALRQADLGIAVVDDLYAFSPASDLILSAHALPYLGKMFAFARESRRTVYLLFAISFCYNLVGLTFAVQGLLTPIVAAILMPVSSFTVVAVALARTRYAWRKVGLPTALTRSQD